MFSLRSCHFARLPSSSGFDSYFDLARLRELNSPSSAMMRPPVFSDGTLVLSAAGFIATRTSGASAAVLASLDQQSFWKAEKSKNVTCAERLSADKSGRDARY